MAGHGYVAAEVDDLLTPRQRHLRLRVKRPTSNASFILAVRLQLVLLTNPQHTANFVAFETQRLRLTHTGQRNDVVQFGNHDFDPHPANGIAGLQVDDVQPAPRIETCGRSTRAPGTN